MKNRKDNLMKQPPLESRANTPDLYKRTLLVFLAVSMILFACMSTQLPQPQAKNVENSDFVNEQLVSQYPLLIPPQLEPRMENGEKVFDLTAQQGETEIFQG